MTELRSKLINELKLRNRSPKTIDAYVSYVYRLAKHYRKSPDLLSIEQIREFLRHLAGECGLSPRTVNVAFNAIVFFYRDILGWSMEGELKGLKRARIPVSLPKFYSRSEVYRLIEEGTASDAQARLFLMLTYSGGLRLAEACGIRWGHVELDREMLRVDCGKGGKDRYVPLSPMVSAPLRMRSIGKEASDFVFPSPQRFKGRSMSLALGGKFYDRALVRSEVSRKGGIHCLRHSYAMHQIERGVSISLLSELMGHSDVKTTMIYLKASRSQVEVSGTPLEGLYDSFYNTERIVS